MVNFDNVNVVAVKTDFQYADLFTKCLPTPRMRFLVDSIRGLDPALPPTSKLQKVKDAVKAGAEAVAAFDLKQYLTTAEIDKTVDEVSADTFFESHFKEANPKCVKEMYEHLNEDEQKKRGSF